MLFFAKALLVLIVAVGADAPGDAVPPTSPSHTSSPSLPPPRVADCVGFALLDDKCTSEWYSCKRAGTQSGSCIEKWETCCTLPGQGARSRLGSAQPVKSTRR